MMACPYSGKCYKIEFLKIQDIKLKVLPDASSINNKHRKFYGNTSITALTIVISVQ